MIYLEQTAKEIADKYHFKYQPEIPCPWACGKVATPRAVRTKDSIGIEYRCVCGAWTAQMRPITPEAIEAWNLIV
jgi:lysyl-tRNA synthetase class I